MRFIDPGNLETFQRFYGFRGVILHAPKDDDAVAGGFDLVGEDLEPVAEAQSGDLAFDQALARLRQRSLRLANADRGRAAFRLAGLHQQFAEEVRFAGAAPSVHTLEPRGRQQRLEYLSCRDFQDGQ